MTKMVRFVLATTLVLLITGAFSSFAHASNSATTSGSPGASITVDSTVEHPKTTPAAPPSSSNQPYQIWSIIINAFIAIGTIAVALLAIWGNWVRSKLIPPKLTIQSHNLRGTVTRFTNGPRVIYYHLSLTNSRSWSVAKNCRVILRTLYRRHPDQMFRQIPLPVPPQFVWSPAEITPAAIELSTQQILDFGRVIEGQPTFEPVLYWYPNNFQGLVAANEAVRYGLEILADGYSAKRYQVFEVAWNGIWSDNLDQMSQNLVIREITVPASPT